MRYTYSRWTGAQTAGPDADELLEAMSEELVNEGRLEPALERITRWGLQGGGATSLAGLDSVLQQLRATRQSELERYSLDSALGDIRERLDDIVDGERRGIDRRRGEADAASAHGSALEAVAERKRSFLDRLPEEPASAVSALAEYEFLDDEAREKFHALSEMLEQHVVQRHFRGLQQSLSDMSRTQLADLKAMLHDLNAMLQRHLQGEPEGFDQFMSRHGRHFAGARSFEDLVSQMREQTSSSEALMASMSPEMRSPLESMLKTILEDHVLREELAQVTESLQAIAPPRPSAPYPFSGQQALTLNEALRLMRRMHDLESLETQLAHALETGRPEEIESQEVRRLLGEAAQHAVEQLQQVTQTLDDAGYVTRSGGRLELTARGIRRIGQTALREIFRDMRAHAFGDHQTGSQGSGGEALDVSRRYEFGDPFLLDLHGTLMNAVERREPGLPVRLQVADFQVFHTEQLTQAATVLMVDMSRSMPLRGCFVAAKKVALALNSLIRLQFPRDQLYVVGFSDYARQLQAEALYNTTWADYVYGTNMQHGFMLARQILGRHKSGTRQIILVTDGEPTAHFEGGKIHFAYPPTFRTFQETLREVRRCSQEGIIINTFMLERSHYLTDFVAQMTRINHGRAFFATPERLGDYIVVDYVKNRAQANS